MESELVLINELKKGNNEVFDMIYKKYYKHLCIFAMQHVNNIDIAEELVQDLFVELLVKRRRIIINSSIKSYLFRAVYYKCIHFYKQSKRSDLLLLYKFEESIQSFNNYSDTLEVAELQHKIYEAIDSLPDQCKRIFKLSRFEQLKYKEIAEKLSITIKAVEAQISKALRILSEKLIDYIP